MNHLCNTLFNNDNHSHADTVDIALDIINPLHGHADFDIISNYYDIDAYNKLPLHDANQLNIVHFNSRSFTKNIDNITAFLNTLSTTPDILAITETWLNTNNKHFHQLPGYHSYHLIRTNRAHGGVSSFISSSLQSEQLQELTYINDNIDINTVNITLNSLSFIVCAIYRPHSKHALIEEFANTLSALLQNNTVTNKKIIILMGDLNINLLEHITHVPTNNFLVSLQTIIFFPHISRPTRFSSLLNIFLQFFSLTFHLELFTVLYQTICQFSLTLLFPQNLKKNTQNYVLSNKSNK